MPVHVVCPECGATTVVEDDSPRRYIECPQCKKHIPIPAAPTAPAAAVPPPLPTAEAATAGGDGGFEVLEDEEEVQETPRRTLADDDDNPRPPVGRRDDYDDDDDDEDDLPRRRSSRDDDAPRRAHSRYDDDDDEDEDEDDDHRPPRSRRRDDDDDDEEEDEEYERPTRARSRYDEDEDEDEDDERSARTRSRDDDDDDDDDDEDERPRRRAAAVHDDDEDDEERPRSRRTSDDDEEEEEDDSIPRRKPGGGYGGSSRGPRPRAKSGKGGLIALALMALILLGAGGGAVAFYYWPKDEDSTVVADNNQNPPEQGLNPPDPNPPVPEPPEPKPPQAKGQDQIGLPIKAVSFEGDRKTIPLPGKVADIRAGGDGRYLILHLPEEKKLLIYDASEAAIVKELPTTGKDARFAAGIGHLLLADNTSRTFQRFDLAKLEKDKEGPYPFAGTIEDLSIGSGSDGPALVLGTMPEKAWPVHFVSLDTLGAADVGWSARPPDDLPRSLNFRAAANGSRWAGVPTGANARGVVIITREGKSLKVEHAEKDKNFGFAALSSDGRTICSRYGATKVGEPITGITPIGLAFPPFLPAVSGDIFVLVVPAKGRDSTSGVKAAAARQPMSPPRSMPTVEIPQPFVAGDALPPDRHVFYAAETGAFVVCPSGPENKLEVVKFDFVKSQPSAGDHITSTPPDMFSPGSTYRYQIRSVSALPNREFQVTGPADIQISDKNVVTWKVPADEKRDRVTIQVKSPKGAVLLQSFDVFNAAAPAPKPVGPKPKDPKSPNPKIPTVGMPPNVAPGVKLVSDPAGRLPIMPPDVKDGHVEVALPGPIRDACVAGGGRYLIFYCASARRLAVFDVNTLQIEKAITVNADEVLFAASMEKLLVVYPDEKFIIRYSLASFRPEADLQLEVRQKPTAAAMGSATAGPLILGGIPAQNNASKMQLMFLDIDSMKEVSIDKAEGDFRVTFGAAAHLRASANGRTLGAWLAQLRPSGLQTARLSGNTISGSYLGETVGHVTPSADGQTIFTEKGMYSAKGEPIGKREPAVPAVHGNWFVTLSPNAKGPADAQIIRVWESGKEKPLAEFDDLPGFNGKRDPFERDNPTLALDRQLFLVPEAKILVVVPPHAKSLHVYRIGEAKK